MVRGGVGERFYSEALTSLSHGRVLLGLEDAKQGVEEAGSLFGLMKWSAKYTSSRP